MARAHYPAEAIYWTLALSLGCHMVLLGAFVLMPPRSLPPPAIQVVAVDLIAVQAPEPPPAPPPAPLTIVPAQAPAGEPGMTQASRFYASGILGDPANQELQGNFSRLADSEQLIQLCNIEALEQLRGEPGADEPDALVGYAFDDMTAANGQLEAKGGAFRRGGQWYHVHYRCTVAADLRSVGAFEYEVGALVPQSEWEEHFLNRNDEGLD